MVTKLTPCVNSQRNESLNSTIGTKNPKTRFYGGSESNDFRVACGVAQTNIGYNYTGKTLEVLNIKPGFYQNKHVVTMDKKVNYDIERKTQRGFKKSRNQLSRQKTSQTLRKEANEGITYASSVGLNLDTSRDKTDFQIAFVVPSDVTVDELKKYEEIIPPYTPRPNINTLPYNSTKKCYFIVFDTETTCTGKMAELCQLSAVSEDGRKEFSTFILPKGSISFGASLVNGLTVKNINGTRTLCKGNSPVQSVTLEEAVREFLLYLKQVKTSGDNNFTTVLIGK